MSLILIGIGISFVTSLMSLILIGLRTLIPKP